MGSIKKAIGVIVGNVHKFLQERIKVGKIRAINYVSYTDSIDAMDQTYLLSCKNPFHNMKIDDVFQFDLKSLRYDCDRRWVEIKKEYESKMISCSEQWKVSDPRSCGDGTTQCDLPKSVKCEPFTCSKLDIPDFEKTVDVGKSHSLNK